MESEPLQIAHNGAGHHVHTQVHTHRYTHTHAHTCSMALSRFSDRSMNVLPHMVLFLDFSSTSFAHSRTT